MCEGIERPEEFERFIFRRVPFYLSDRLMTFAKDKPLIGVNVKRTATKQTEDGEGWRRVARGRRVASHEELYM
jgi:hypothetical protein